MSFFGKYFARSADGGMGPKDGKLSELGLQVLFASPPVFGAASFLEACRSFHPSLARAECEVGLNPEKTAMVGGLKWANHAVAIVGLATPFPGPALEHCVGPAHYPPDLKARARAHKAHLLLYYSGGDPSPLEQYVALATVASIFGKFGGFVVLNKSARTLIPNETLSPSPENGDFIEQLRSMPLLMLYCALLKYQVKAGNGVWMRTHGAELLGLPNLAARGAGYHDGQLYFDLFSNILGYLLNSGSKISPGQTMEIGPDKFFTARRPGTAEQFLVGDGELLIVEVVEG